MESTTHLLTVKDGAALLHVSVPTFWRRVADGTVPKPLKIGSLSRWLREDIEAVIECAKGRRAPAYLSADAGDQPAVGNSRAKSGEAT